MSGLKNDVQGQKSFLQVVTGVDRPSAKRYRTLNHHVKRAVAAYGRAEILVYYDMVATGLMISFPQLFPEASCFHVSMEWTAVGRVTLHRMPGQGLF